MAASFVRSPIREQERVRYLIAAPNWEIEARWDGLGEAIFAYGPAPQKPESLLPATWLIAVAML